MNVLTYGHRLAILKQAWGFSINQTLADFISGDDGAAASGKKRLNQATVTRWLGEKGGTPRDIPLEQAISGLAEFFEQNGYLGERQISKDAVIKAMKTDDLSFSKFVAGAADDPLPIPSGVQKLNGNGKFKSDRLVGRYCLYRLGIEVKRQGRAYLFTGQEPTVLRRVPVDISGQDKAFLNWKEDYRGNKSNGFVMVLDEYITVWGEDDNIQNYSELFLAQINPYPTKDGLLEGIIAMDGDAGRPTAYRVLIRKVTGEDAKLSWADFVAKYETEVVLHDSDGDGDLEPKDIEFEEEFNYKYADYVNVLQTKPTRTDLQN